MADTPAIPPSSPVTTSTGTASSAPVTPAEPIPPQLRLADVIVRQAPAALTKTDAPVVVEGRVISSNPQTQVIRIQTTAGMVEVQSNVPLPADTEVTVEIYTDKNQTLANIVVQRKVAAMEKQLEQVAQPKQVLPPPPLQEGKTVTALLLPKNYPPQIAQLAAALETFKKTDLQKLQLPLQPEQIKQFMEAPDIGSFLEKLPPQQLQKLLNAPDIRNILEKPAIQQAQPLNASPPQMRQLLNTPDMRLFLEKLPPSQQQQISSAPDIETFLAKMPPEKLPQLLSMPDVRRFIEKLPPQRIRELFYTLDIKKFLKALPPEQIQRLLNAPAIKSLLEKLPQQAEQLLHSPDIKKILDKIPSQQLQKTADTILKAFISDAEKPPLPGGEEIRVKGLDAPSSLSPALRERAGEKAAGQPMTLPENNFIPKPPANIIQKLISAYLPQALGSKPEMPATSISSAPDPDNNALPAMRPPLHAKTTQITIQSSAPQVPARFSAPPLPVPDALGTLLAFAEKIRPSQGTPFAHLLPQAFQPTPSLPENMYRLNILKILPPSTPPEQVEMEFQKLVQEKVSIPQLTEVETITPSGFPILKTVDPAMPRNAGDHFVLKTPDSIPTGSIVIIKAIPMTAEEIMQPENLKSTRLGRMPATQSFDPGLPAWPALDEALQVIQQTNPPAAHALRNTLPTPTPHLVPTALFFLAALRLGAIEGWLGDNTLQALREAGKKDLAERLGSDFSKISRQSKEPLMDEWRSISMPLLHEDQINQLQFYVRKQYDQDSTGNDPRQKPATRFILNLHLTRMGEMQLDGFIQKKNFDIVLRTEEKLPFEMRQELMKRFAQGLDQVAMQGGISFQTRQQGWITVELPHQPGVVA